MRIDWLAADEIEELQAFIDERWRRGHPLAYDERLLRWQYGFPDDSERLSVLVARESGAVVGMLGLILVPFALGGRRCSGAWLTTWIATPEARRGQGGLRLLQRALEEPFGFVGTIGANDTALRILRALGFSVRASIPRWVRVVSDEALERLLGGRSSGYGRPSSPLPSAGGLRVETWGEESGGRWDELWERRLAPELVGPWRDAEYLRWRYLEHPRVSYAVRVAHDVDGAVRGLAVHRLVDVAGTAGRVMRMVELHGDAEAMTALVSDTIAVAEREDVAYAEFFCSAGAVGEPLEACGFTLEAAPTHELPSLLEPVSLQSPAGLTGAFRAGPGLGGESAVFQSDAVYVTRGDCDQDGPQ
jgi:hypothetical protein